MNTWSDLSTKTQKQEEIKQTSILKTLEFVNIRDNEMFYIRITSLSSRVTFPPSQSL